MKTKTKSQIKKQAKQLFKELKRLYNKLDNLMDESEIAVKGMTDTELKAGKDIWFNTSANIIQASRDNVELAYDNLEVVTGPMP